MNPVRFSYNPSFLRSYWFRNTLIISIFVALVLAGVYGVFCPGVECHFDEFDLVDFIFIIAGVSALLFFFVPLGKVHRDFEIDEFGIRVGGKNYLWGGLQFYHWMGQSQSERPGLVVMRGVGYDYINPYKGTNIIRVQYGSKYWPRFLDLQVDPARTKELVSFLEGHGITPRSRTHLFIFNTNALPFLLLLVIPLIVVLVIFFLTFLGIREF